MASWKPNPNHEQAAREAGKASWLAWVAEIEARKGYPICGRMNAQRAPCGLKPMAGRPACYFHGGASKKGAESPTWKDGSYSKYAGLVKGKLAEQYERLGSLISDAFDLTAEARIIDGQLAVVVDSLGDGHVSGRELAEIAGALRRAVEAEEGLLPALGDLDALVARAQQADASWGQFLRFTEAKRRLADTHARQKAREYGPVSWSDVALVAEILKVGILNHVPREKLGAFLEWAETLRTTNPAMSALLRGGPTDERN